MSSGCTRLASVVTLSPPLRPIMPRETLRNEHLPHGGTGSSPAGEEVRTVVNRSPCTGNLHLGPDCFDPAAMTFYTPPRGQCVHDHQATAYLGIRLSMGRRGIIW